MSIAKVDPGKVTEVLARARRNPVPLYAPLVYLHPDERFKPMSAAAFIKQSSLRWHHEGRRDHEEEKQGKIDAEKLGNGGYRHRGYRSDERIAPRHNKRADGEGFFLDAARDTHFGQGTSAPVYYVYWPKHYIIYWFFYAYNDGWSPFGNHVGDWENITVQLDKTKNIARRVAYYAHGDVSEDLEWKDVPKYRNTSHPIVYSAIGSHASYHKAGLHWHGVIPDYTKRGPRWETWNKLRDAKECPWYGYGGGWGKVGARKGTTGPEGPKFKERDVVPRKWLR
jgi:hypothetical protein